MDDDENRGRRRDFEHTFRRLATDLKEQILHESRRNTVGPGARRAPRFFEYPTPAADEQASQSRAPAIQQHAVTHFHAHKGDSQHLQQQYPTQSISQGYDLQQLSEQPAPSQGYAYPTPPMRGSQQQQQSVGQKRSAQASGSGYTKRHAANGHEGMVQQVQEIPSMQSGLQMMQMPLMSMPGLTGGVGELRLARTLLIPLSRDDGVPSSTNIELVPEQGSNTVLVIHGSGQAGQVTPAFSRWLAPLLRAGAVRCDGNVRRTAAGAVADVNVYVDVERVDLSLAEAWRALVAAMAVPQ